MEKMLPTLFACLVSLSSAHAGTAPAPEGLYGPEFTFTLDGKVPAEAKIRFVQQVRYHLTEFQPAAARFTEEWINGDFTFTSPNGWWFRISDNPGVVEIQMKPMSVAETRRFKADIQDAIFASAATAGLFPWDYLGGGHLNIDTRVFGGRLLLARNFVVDFWNHSELSMGVLNYDTNNAMPLALYREEYVDKIRAILELADRGEFGDGDEAISRFLLLIDEVLVSGSSHFHHSQRNKHHDLNFSHAGRIEIRSLRPQASADVWLNQIELIESRIKNHLAPMNAPLPLKFKVPAKFPLNFSEGPEGSAHTPPVNPQRAIKAFYKYVAESKLEWTNHRGYMWPPWQEELKKFECEKGLEN